MTPKNGFLLFIASCLSGCGQMYQGYMKRGVSLLLAFCLVLFASTYFFLGTLALFLPVIWLYAFFDSYALRSQLSAGTAPEDAFLFGLSDMDSKRLGALLHKRHSLIGWVLVAVGVYMLYDMLMGQLSGLFFGWFGEWLYSLLRYGLPRVVITVLVICGVLMLVSMFFPHLDLTLALKLSPLILVCLGVEVLLASRREGKLRYDWVGMVLCFVLVTAALVFFGIAWCLVYRPETVICY